MQYPGAAWTGVNRQGREKRRRWNIAGEVNPRIVDGLSLMRWRDERPQERMPGRALALRELAVGKGRANGPRAL